VKTLLKSVHIYQSYCKKNLAQFFFGPPCIWVLLSFVLTYQPAR